MATKKSAGKKGSSKKSGGSKKRAGGSKKSSRKKGDSKKKASTKRELIDTGRNKSYVRRDKRGRFDEVDDVGRSLSQDIKRPAKKKVPAGQGDRGDQKRSK